MSALEASSEIIKREKSKVTYVNRFICFTHCYHKYGDNFYLFSEFQYLPAHYFLTSVAIRDRPCL